MCKCTPEIRTPFCGKPGCEWPEQVDRPKIVNGPERIRELEAALMVYDVTLFCLVASGTVDELLRGQVRAAAEAHQRVMGEPSMLVENRCKKNFLEKNDASGR